MPVCIHHAAFLLPASAWCFAHAVQAPPAPPPAAVESSFSTLLDEEEEDEEYEYLEEGSEDAEGSALLTASEEPEVDPSLLVTNLGLSEEVR